MANSLHRPNVAFAPTGRPWRPAGGGVTMIELIIALMILSFAVAGGFRAFQVFAGKTSQNLSQRLILQMEARRAIVGLYKVIQDGIEVVVPFPGQTLPYLVFRDFLNNVQIVYLEKDPDLSREEGEDLYKVMMGLRDPSGQKAVKPKVLMRYVAGLNFTTHHVGGVFISCSMRGGKGKFSMVNYVRLKNMAAE